MQRSLLTSALLVLALACSAQDGPSPHCGTLDTLKVGDTAPVFNVADIHGASVDLPSLTKEHEVVLVFYRGAWCPYCNKHMSHLQDSLSLITAKNAVVLAISPELPESAEDIVKKSGASFSVIHDEGYRIMCAYGTAFEMPKAQRNKLKLMGLNVDKANGNEEGVLPVPATFIIGRDGRIKAVHFDANYKERMSVKAILSALEG
ncbi:MAG TPA: peroxiredoxin-like family protein [Flavobacteriales bacterium]|nr:peroxiredoxin-like family protein [Flavobacteriales bacterium]HMR28700.1 peroxiredoxin-like family protein [Flavobacteriales bacterium]